MARGCEGENRFHSLFGWSVYSQSLPWSGYAKVWLFCWPFQKKANFSSGFFFPPLFLFNNLDFHSNLDHFLLSACLGFGWLLRVQIFNVKDRMTDWRPSFFLSFTQRRIGQPPWSTRLLQPVGFGMLWFYFPSVQNTLNFPDFLLLFSNLMLLWLDNLPSTISVFKNVRRSLLWAGMWPSWRPYRARWKRMACC